MSKLIYLDTCVWMDYFEEREGATVTENILVRCLDCEFGIVLSDWVLTELDNYVSSNQTKMWFSILNGKGKLIKASRTDEDVEYAKQIDEHFQDPLHAILANKAGASMLVTRNIQDFSKCRHLVKIVFPEYV